MRSFVFIYRPMRFFLLSLLASISLLHAADPVSFRVSDFEFERPANWHWVPASSPMRKAHLQAPGAAEDAQADVIFFHFGAGQGGTVEANVNRWVAQFQNAESATSTEKIGNTAITYVKSKGTFLSGMPGTSPVPLENQGLRGAILESPNGDVYVKMTGPLATVEASEAAFIEMVRKAAGQ